MPYYVNLWRNWAHDTDNACVPCQTCVVVSLSFCLLNTIFVIGVGGWVGLSVLWQRPDHMMTALSLHHPLLVLGLQCSGWEAGEMATTHVNVAPTAERYRSYIWTQWLFQSFGWHFETEGEQWVWLPWKVFQRAVVSRELSRSEKRGLSHRPRRRSRISFSCLLTVTGAFPLLSWA